MIAPWTNDTLIEEIDAEYQREAVANVNAWAIRERHFHAREQTLESYICAREAKFAAEHRSRLNQNMENAHG